MGKKDQERSTARHMFVEQLKSLSEISVLLKVSNNTLTTWSKNDGWKEARDSKINGSHQAVKDIKQVLSDLAEQRLALSNQQKEATDRKDWDTLRELNKQAAALSDECSKWNKQLMNADEPRKVQLHTYLNIMDDIFNALNGYDQKLYLASLDFQEMHIRTISKKLG